MILRNEGTFERRGLSVRFAPCPCHVVPSNMSIEPAQPQASHATASAAGRGPLCEPAMNRVAPFSTRNSSTMKMKPTSGYPSASGATS